MRRFVGLALVSAAFVSLASAACSSSSDGDASTLPPDASLGSSDSGPVFAGPMPDGAIGAPDGAASDAATTGDGGSPIATPNETAGTRLRPTYQRALYSDGAEQLTFRGMQDTQRKEACVAETLTDGQLHCAPPGEPAVFTPDTTFSDAACSQPVVGVSHTTGSTSGLCHAGLAETNRYFRIQSGGCGSVHIVPFPTASPLAISRVYQMSGGKCTAMDLSTTSTTYEIYASGATLSDVDPSSFVSLTQSTTHLTPTGRVRLDGTVTKGADGSMWTTTGNLDDTQINAYCSAETATDGMTRCLPYSDALYHAQTGYYAASTCTGNDYELAGESYTSCGSDPMFLKTYMQLATTDSTGCSAREAIYPHFTTAPQTNVYSLVNGTCTAYPNSIDVYPGSALLPEVAPSTFPPVTHASVPATSYGLAGSRIHFVTDHYTAPDGLDGTSGYIGPFDSQAGASCIVNALDDQQAHCIPNYNYFAYSPTRGNYYSDSMCTTAVYGVTSASAACNPTPPATTALFSDEETSVADCYELHLYTVPATPLASPTLYTTDQNGHCAATATPTNTYFYNVKDCTHVPSSSFVGVTMSLETR